MESGRVGGLKVCIIGCRHCIIWELSLLNVLSIMIKISNKGTTHGAKWYRIEYLIPYELQHMHRILKG